MKAAHFRRAKEELEERIKNLEEQWDKADANNPLEQDRIAWKLFEAKDTLAAIIKIIDFIEKGSDYATKKTEAK